MKCTHPSNTITQSPQWLRVMRVRRTAAGASERLID